MICQPCRKQEHQECRGGTWCDCQHQPVDSIGIAISALNVQLRRALAYMKRTYGPEAPAGPVPRVPDEYCCCGVGKGHEPGEHGTHCPIRQFHDRQQIEGVPGTDPPQGSPI